ncbi:unnamed protein product [Phyllotreta striolata]|uniref:Major facilitator superfamily (MFS) profile domain-containing protein n=1 Tax=Phyllotreta striolata TaxID=444603 RepID=A0A9N9TIW5_PHYSR|nr:unnamed protein product [Phyllotreta striolata]
MLPAASEDLLDNKQLTANTKVYKRRWIILTIFILYALGNSFQWVEYSIVTNMVVKYYNVSSLAVDWTAIIYLCIYPVIVVPVSYVIEIQGLRVTALIGGIVTALAAVIKVFSIDRDLFYVILLGQALGSTAQVFILCLPPKIAAVWFKPSEASLANSLGVFGTQLGFGLGFLVPSMTIRDIDDMKSIAADFRKLSWMLAIYMVPVATAIVFYFPHRPPLPPSVVQTENKNQKRPTFREFCIRFIEIMKEPGFALQSLAYGTNIGSYAAFTTFLNQFVLQHFKDGQEDAGRMGLFSVGVGMVGTIISGAILDKTHKYKETNLIVCYMSVVSVLAMVGSLWLGNMTWTYMACMLIGFFLNAYWATGIELGVELSYPADEIMATGILTAASQGIGCFVCWALGPFNLRFGALWSLVLLAALLLIGALLTQFVPNIRKRQEEFKRNVNGAMLLTSPVATRHSNRLHRHL